MFGLTLSELAPELLPRLESCSEKDRKRVIRDFFVERLKQDEMAYAGVKPEQYGLLEAIVLKDLLPSFEDYLARRQAILDQKLGRVFWKYVLGTILLTELVATFLTRGRSFDFRLFVPSLLFESLLGAGLFYVAGKVYDWQIRYARSKVMARIEELDNRFQIDQQYESFKEAVGADDLAGSEALDLVSQYSSMRDFWQDYERARRADPSSPEELAQLGIPLFEKFLSLHAKGTYNQVSRNRRFNLLFIHAHQIFLRQNPNYISEFFAWQSDLTQNRGPGKETSPLRSVATSETSPGGTANPAKETPYSLPNANSPNSASVKRKGKMNHA